MTGSGLFFRIRLDEDRIKKLQETRKNKEAIQTAQGQENLREMARRQRTIIDIRTFPGKEEEDISEWLIC